MKKLINYNIVIIGSGGIGIRHLQSLMKINLPISIYVIDKNFKALTNSKKIVKDSKKNNKIKSIIYQKKIERFKLNIDLAIIATNADIRRKVIENFISKNKIKYMLIEKVAFQCEKDFIKIITLLKKHRIKSWVNLAKRLFPIFKNLKNKIKKSEKILINASSGNFDIGCNAIHYLDLFYYLTKSKIKDVDMSLMDKRIYKSKRKGYIDFNGTLKVNNIKKDQLIITNYFNSPKDHILEIHTEKFYYLFFPYKDKLYYSSKNNKKLIEKDFYQPKQSQLTHQIAKDILLYGKSELPTLEESYIVHRPMLKAFIDHVNSFNKIQINKCNIT